MIVYDLYCDCGYRTEAWFASSDDYQKQLRSGLIECPSCHSVAMHKQMSAPYVHIPQKKCLNIHQSNLLDRLLKSSWKKFPKKSKTLSENAESSKNIEDLVHPIKEIMDALVDFTLTHSEDVGKNFPKLARQMKAQEIPKRFIRGEANASEVETLREEGIECLYLPIPSKNKWN